jgi:hypothetical protein
VSVFHRGFLAVHDGVDDAGVETGGSDHLLGEEAIAVAQPEGKGPRVQP